MHNHDIFGDLGNNTLENVVRAFGEANTDFIKVDEHLTLTEEDHDISSDNPDPEQMFIEEKNNLLEKISILTGTNYQDWENNKTYIFGCRTFLANHPNFQGVYDISAYPTNHNGTMLGVSFIFSANGKYIGTEQPTLEKQEITSRVIHELGHSRGRRLADTFGYGVGFTDETHTTGHNGWKKGLCLMRVPGNSSDERYTDNLFKKTIAEPHFCYGHIQMLYNCTFVEGGN